MKTVLSLLLCLAAATALLFPVMLAPQLRAEPLDVLFPAGVVALALCLRKWPAFAVGALVAVHKACHVLPGDDVGAGVWAIAAALCAGVAIVVGTIEDL